MSPQRFLSFAEQFSTIYRNLTQLDSYRTFYCSHKFKYKHQNLL